MTRFITTMRMLNEVINADDIVKIREEAKPRGQNGTRSIAYLRDGETFEVMLGAETIADNCCPVVSAQPGFELLCAWYDVETKTTDCTRAPVIAWRIIPFGEPVPITPEDDKMSDNTALRYPDGRITVPWDRNYETEQEWLDAMKIEFEKPKTLVAK